MKKYTILTALLLMVLSIALPEESQAQTRHKRAKVKVVKRPVVVKKHPRIKRRAHVRYAHLPRWGTAVSVIPAGAILIKSHTHPYYFHNGIYYAHRNNNYVVVRPAAGLRIRVLPVGYRRVVIGPRHYYYYYGTFYSKANNSDEYIVVDAPEGAIVDALPDGYEVKTIGDTEYYVLDGVYYAEVDAEDMEDGIGYQVVKL